VSALISRVIALVMAVSVGLVFGVHDSVAKLKFENADPALLSFSTLLLGFPLLIALLPLSGGLRVTPASAAVFVVAGILNFSVGRTLMYMATRRLSSSGASVMTSTSAAFSAVMSLLLGERVTISDLLGIAAIMLAVYMASGWRRGDYSPSGVAIGLSTGLVIASSVAIIKVGEELGGSPGLGVIIAYISGLAALGPRANLRLVRGQSAKYVSIMGVAAALGQLLRYLALTSLNVDVVTPLQNLRPIAATAILYEASEEAGKHPLVRHWAAAVLAFLGVALVSGLL